jgi:hypothetical protein
MTCLDLTWAPLSPGCPLLHDANVRTCSNMEGRHRKSSNYCVSKHGDFLTSVAMGSKSLRLQTVWHPQIPVQTRVHSCTQIKQSKLSAGMRASASGESISTADRVKEALEGARPVTCTLLQAMDGLPGT